MLSRDWPMHDRCGAAGVPSPMISRTVASVPSCVEPPAPKVTEQNSGCSAYSFCRAARSLSAPSAVLGGKNSRLIGTVVMSSPGRQDEEFAVAVATADGAVEPAVDGQAAALARLAQALLHHRIQRLVAHDAT